MKKLKIALGIILYFVLAFSLAFSLVNCSGRVHKHAPACFTYANSNGYEQSKAITKSMGKIKVKSPKKHK
jgi:ACR3 family arsenite efflux pump ArsB